MAISFIRIVTRTISLLYLHSLLRYFSLFCFNSVASVNCIELLREMMQHVPSEFPNTRSVFVIIGPDQDSSSSSYCCKTIQVESLHAQHTN